MITERRAGGRPLLRPPRTPTTIAPTPHPHPPPAHLEGRQLRLQLVRPGVQPREPVDALLVLQRHVHRGCGGLQGGCRGVGGVQGRRRQAGVRERCLPAETGDRTIFSPPRLPRPPGGPLGCGEVHWACQGLPATKSAGLCLLATSRRACSGGGATPCRPVCFAPLPPPPPPSPQCVSHSTHRGRGRRQAPTRGTTPCAPAPRSPAPLPPCGGHPPADRISPARLWTARLVARQW